MPRRRPVQPIVFAHRCHMAYSRHMAYHPKNHGFSLVELSIVLVILGLLAGGIVAGQSLIRASELRAVTAEYARHSTAVQNFRTEFNAIPGDMTNATDYWGEDPNGCPTNLIQTPREATCNGNGDNIMRYDQNENLRAWQQLANAGFMEGSYTGVGGASAGQETMHIPGVNSPLGRIARTTWSFNNFDTMSDAVNGSWWWNLRYPKMLVVGIPNTSWPTGGFLNTTEAWNIDKKLDDGKPGTGAIWSNRANCTTATADTQYLTADYNPSTSGNACALIFLNAY